jgi:hypothetical protein
MQHSLYLTRINSPEHSSPGMASDQLIPFKSGMGPLLAGVEWNCHTAHIDAVQPEDDYSFALSILFRSHHVLVNP